ncbi:uncharacterized protein EV420DRAFT_1479578 [Desarmillaria tabescens]|uniref:Uncharacterized protein n=1 Tax=Armillaria tabescens TaxID=1929756 RepID=A0AA39KFH5_ARMTA|nr:uncharacterized protein EV420DRAFT_1479578 [Desarmillaria tabescens]KAK0458921.1 hypothetical protein EV420DRAFT_1479578 [Desarmillaria tabescens]
MAIANDACAVATVATAFLLDPTPLARTAGNLNEGYPEQEALGMSNYAPEGRESQLTRRNLVSSEATEHHFRSKVFSDVKKHAHRTQHDITWVEHSQRKLMREKHMINTKPNGQEAATCEPDGE